jgi:hypothetical protein
MLEMLTGYNAHRRSALYLVARFRIFTILTAWRGPREFVTHLVVYFYIYALSDVLLARELLSP